jgi:hypothetical protein
LTFLVIYLLLINQKILLKQPVSEDVENLKDWITAAGGIFVFTTLLKQSNGSARSLFLALFMNNVYAF